jgi:hypothetical protein
MSSNEKPQSPKPEKPQKPIEVPAPPLVVATESYQPPIQKNNNHKNPK